MTDTTVAYHVEDGDGRPAIHVRDSNAGAEYGIALQRLFPRHLDAELMAQAIMDGPAGDAAYERVRSDFWQNAEEIATQRGLGEIAQEGRSGGWLVFTDGRDPQEMDDRAEDSCPDPDTCLREHGGRSEWLAAYRAMVEWADAWIADAPRKVASLAQQYAMDEAGEGAARRMFATFRAVRA